MSSRRPLVALLALTGLVLAACSSVGGTATRAPVSGAAPVSPSAGAPQITTPGAPAPAPAEPGDLASYYDQELSWFPCTDLGTEDHYLVDGVDCAYLTVPLSYEDPGLADIQIAVLRATSTADTPKGSLLVNPGGPGASGAVFVGTYASLAGNTGSPTGVTVTDLLAEFDLIGFDPRGVGASKPAVRCLTDQERDDDRAVSGAATADSVTEANKATEAMVAMCAERTVVDGVDGATVLGHFGTRDAARDMDVLRAALGDEQLTYLGFSYGTKLGYVYAEQFPQRVRAMVLDGAVAPDADPVTSLLGQAEGFQLAFDSFAQWCSTVASCPLGNDPAQATAVFQELTRPLVTDPIKLSDGRVLTFGDATTGVAAALYQDTLRQTLVQALADLGAGRGEGLMALADWYLDRAADGSYSNSMEAFDAVRCLDDTKMTDLQQATELQHRYNQAAPFQDSGQPVGGYLDICAYWPAEPTWTPHRLDIPELKAPILVISTTGDPATPYADGVELAAQLKADLLTYEGDRHTAFLGAASECVDKAVLEYFRNPAKTGDAVC